MNTYFSTGIDEIFLVCGGRWNLRLVFSQNKIEQQFEYFSPVLSQGFCID